MNVYFEGIRVVSPEDGTDGRMNVWIKDGVIVHCSAESAEPGAEARRIDGTNLVMSPGLFDMHVHLREPGQEYKETVKTGTDAAANGGFTGVLCMPNTEPAIDNLPTVEYIRNRAADTLCEVYICGAITQGRKGLELAPMLEMLDAGVVMFSDDGAAVRSAEVMRRAFQYLAPFDGLLSEHCEEHDLTENFAMNEGIVSAELGLRGYPAVAEEIIINRDILLADYCGNRRYHVSHMSTAGGVRIVREAKSRGRRISCEVTPHHFVLTEEAVREYGANAKMNPPLRTDADRDALIEGLRDGTVDVIATDHAPHADHEKEIEFANAANGILGLETSLGLSLHYLVHKGHISLRQLIEKMSVNPRRILGLPAIKIAVGEQANITVFAPDEVWKADREQSYSKSRNMPFHDFELRGKPRFAINRGKLWECKL